MSDTVFILGAGASKLAGAPLMFDFLDVASDLLRANLAGEKKEDFERVFRAIGQLQTVHSKAQLDINNIESVFNAFELARLIGRLPGFDSDEIPLVIASLKELIVKTLEMTMRFRYHSTSILAPEPYDDFVNLLKQIRQPGRGSHSVSVITFNYDVAIDLALLRNHLGVRYGLDPTEGKENSIEVFKLHGSLNWASETETKKIIPLRLNDYLPHSRAYLDADFPKLTVGSDLQTFFGGILKKVVDREPVIIPPTWNKGDYHSALSTVWSAAAKSLSGASNIVIIGYSLPETDSYFRLLYALGCVGEIPLRRIIVINPEAPDGDVDKRFRSLLGPAAIARYEYHPIGFKESIGMLRKRLVV